MNLHESVLIKNELFELYKETGIKDLESAISFAKFGNTEKFNLKKISEIFINELSGCSLFSGNVRMMYSNIAKSL